MLEKMLLEASHLLQGIVSDVAGVRHGRIDKCVFSADQATLVGFQVATSGVLTRFRSLAIQDCISLNHEAVVIDSAAALGKDMKALDEIASRSGAIIGVSATTESGARLGTISDVLLDADTGIIVRFYLRKLLAERIIPREYLVSITPKQVVFKDVVNTPVFSQIATSEAVTG
jgi:uncharacterized protein YrrD